MKNLMICALALALAGPAIAQARTADEQPAAVAVRYGDLDLTKARDAEVMVRRMDRAAAAACGATAASLREVQQAVRNSACFHQSMDRAMADLGSPTVNAVYRERGMTVAAN